MSTPSITSSTSCEVLKLDLGCPTKQGHLMVTGLVPADVYTLGPHTYSERSVIDYLLLAHLSLRLNAVRWHYFSHSLLNDVPDSSRLTRSAVCTPSGDH
ncbi:hypothetical protein ElyMa_001414800 [Elysia marginata]|uniref:Uncharacterized protein n=1 Tax=Elysia marginata TaxID=1093978 RepID=A0AAV4IWG9_9GAST|nr:hypothetical protein ElyMa_001414800 [Elysia marginata]